MSYNIGELYFSLFANTANLDDSYNKLKEFSSKVQDTRDKIKSASSSIVSSMQAQEKAAAEAMQKFSAMQQKIVDMQQTNKNLSSQQASAMINRASAATDSFVSSVTAGTKKNGTMALPDMRNERLKFNLAMKGVQQDINSLNFRQRAEDANKLAGSLRVIADMSSLALGPLSGMASRIMNIRELIDQLGTTQGVLVAGTTGAIALIASLGVSAVTSANQLNMMKQALTAVTGSQEMAANQLQFIIAVSNQSGLSIEALGRSYSNFLAASNMAGISLQNTEGMFKRVALAAGTLQLSAEDTKGVFRALEQIISKGTVQSEELRGQLADRMPAAFGIAAKAVFPLAKNTEEATVKLNAMLKQGKVISKDFVPAFVDAMTKAYNIDVTKPVDNFNASVNRMQNSWTVFNAEIDKSLKLSATVTKVINVITSSIDFLAAHTNTLVAVFGAAGAALIAFGVAYGVVQGVAMAIAAWPEILAACSAAWAVLTSAEAAWAAVTEGVAILVGILTGNIPLLIGVLAGTAAAVWAGTTAFDSLKKSLDANNTSFAATDSIHTYILKQQELQGSVSATNQLLREQRALLLSKAAVEIVNQGNALKEQARQLKEHSSAYETEQQKAMSTRPGRKYVASTLVQEETAALIKATDEYKRKVAEYRTFRDDPNMGASTNPNAKLDFNVNNIIGEGKNKGAKNKKDKTPVDKGRRDVDTINDLINEYEAAKKKFSDAVSNPQDMALADDIAKARNIVNSLKPESVDKINAALVKAGMTSGDMGEKIRTIITQIRLAKEGADNFKKAWEDVDKAANENDMIAKQLEAINNGGGSDAADHIKAVADAAVQLQNVPQENLDALLKRLIALGATGNTAADALANFYEKTANNKKKLDLAKSWEGTNGYDGEKNKYADMVRQAEEDNQNIKDLIQSYNTKSVLETENTKAMQEIDKKYDQMVTDLVAKYGDMYDEKQIGKFVMKLNEAELKQLRLNRVLDEQRIKAEEAQQAWSDLASTISSTFEDAILSGGSLTKDILPALEDELKKIALRVLVIKPFEKYLDGVFNGKTTSTGDIAAPFSKEAMHSDLLSGAVSGLFGGLSKGTEEDKNATKSLWDKLFSPGETALKGMTDSVSLVSGLLGNNSKNALLGQVAALASNVLGLGASTTANLTGATTVAVFDASLISSIIALNTFTAVLAASAATSEGSSAISSIASVFSASGGFDVPSGKNPLTLLHENEMVLPAKYANIIRTLDTDIFNGTATNSRLTSPSSFTNINIDFKPNIDARGATPDAVEALREEMNNQIDALQSNLGTIIDTRVIESSSRGRFGR